MSIDIIENLLGRIQTTQVRSIKENVIARDVGVNSIQKIKSGRLSLRLGELSKVCNQCFLASLYFFNGTSDSVKE